MWSVPPRLEQGTLARRPVLSYMGSGALALLRLCCAWLALHPADHQVPAGTYLASEGEGKAPAGATSTSQGHLENAESLPSTSRWAAPPPPRLQGPLEDHLQPSANHASVGLQLRLQEQAAARMVQWLPCSLWERDLAGLPALQIQERSRWKEERALTGDGNPELRTGREHRAAVEQVYTSSKARYSIADSNHSRNSIEALKTGRSCGLYGTGGGECDQRTIQGPNPTGTSYSYRQAYQDSCCHKHAISEPYTQSSEQGEPSENCLSEEPCPCCPARWTMESLCGAPADQFSEAEGSLCGTAQGGCGSNASSSKEMGRGPARDPADHPGEDRPCRGAERGDGTCFGSSSQHALGCGGRGNRGWRHGGATTDFEGHPRCGCTPALPQTEAGRIAAGQGPENRSLMYEPCAPFQFMAAQDKQWLRMVLSLFGLASFHFRQIGRLGTSHLLKGWFHRLAFWAILAPILRWFVFGLPAVDHFLLEYVNGGDFSMDYLYVIFLGTGFIIDIVAGIHVYLWNLVKFLVDLFCDPFLPQRKVEVVIVRKRRHAQRGRLKTPTFSFLGFCLLVVCCGAEYNHVQMQCTTAQSNFIAPHGDPFDYGFGKNCSIGEPARPPDVPGMPFDSLSDDDAAPNEPVVLLMNTQRAQQQFRTLQEQAFESSWQGAYNLIMFGYYNRPLERRDATLENFDEATIQAAVRSTWSDYEGHFELYNIDPQPDPLQHEGWVTIVFIRGLFEFINLGTSLSLRKLLRIGTPGLLMNRSLSTRHTFCLAAHSFHN